MTRLGSLIAQLQRRIAARKLTRTDVEDATAELQRIGYAYDKERFPPLKETTQWPDQVGQAPRSLAEAFIWKLGRWKAYRGFVDSYAGRRETVLNSDVVMAAFARHLRKPEEPIYDQHALRALWAIDLCLSESERSKCKSYLVKRNGEWKNSGSGRDAVACYEGYVRRTSALCAEPEAATLLELDLLLMPMGQALKRETKNYSEFAALCKLTKNKNA